MKINRYKYFKSDLEFLNYRTGQKLLYSLIVVAILLILSLFLP